jgi:hypothetical protein
MIITLEAETDAPSAEPGHMIVADSRSVARPISLSKSYSPQKVLKYGTVAK